MTITAPKDRYWEDFAVGERVTTEGVTLSEGAIIEFALRYDPQPFHVNREAAEASPFGGIIASSWHVRAAAFRMVVQSGFLGPNSLGSPGSGETRYLLPVRPGDTLKTTMSVLDKRASKSKPDRGFVTVLYEIKNQRDELVIDFSATQMMRRRPAETDAAADA